MLLWPWHHYAFIYCALSLLLYSVTSPPLPLLPPTLPNFTPTSNLPLSPINLTTYSWNTKPTTPSHCQHIFTLHCIFLWFLFPSSDSFSASKPQHQPLLPQLPFSSALKLNTLNLSMLKSSINLEIKPKHERSWLGLKRFNRFFTHVSIPLLHGGFGFWSWMDQNWTWLFIVLDIRCHGLCVLSHNKDFSYASDISKLKHLEGVHISQVGSS